jgi:acetylornithine deacetylase/succinyl-diaminopimelate desuccinylase-like protein
LQALFSEQLTFQSNDGWVSQAKFPFINVGTPGVYNITAAEGRLGVELRPIPQDHTDNLKDAVETFCAENGLDVHFLTVEQGIACSPDNPALRSLMEAVTQVSGAVPKIGKKLAGTSARFAPNSQGVVWGQSGIGPHAKDERHYIPSILPYYETLGQWSEQL